MESTKKNYKNGEIIFQQGEQGDCAYIVDKGQVEIAVAHEEGGFTPIAMLGQGQIFGEMALIDGSPRSAKASAFGECQLTLVSKGQITERIEKADSIVRLLIIMLMNRIRIINSNLSKDEKQTHTNLTLVKDEISENTVLKKIKFEKELTQALENDELEMFFQPIVDLDQKDTVAGFEALIRWQHPEKGLVRPDIFMGVAEETSLIVPMGDWIFKSSCEALKKMREVTGNDKLFMSINVSGRQFADPGFFSRSIKEINNLGIDPRFVKLEITETLLAEGEFVKTSIDKCRSKGFEISLDDFGTGYSSLSYISDFNIDNLKLDQSFVRKMQQDSVTEVIVQSVVDMSKNLSIPVIAEGIEDEESKCALAAMGCKYGQGYLFSKPVPLPEAIAYLQNPPRKLKKVS